MIGANAYNSAIWLPLAAAIFAAAMGVYGWRRRDVPGGLPFAASSLLVALILMAVAAETASHSLSAKIAWYRFQVVWQIPAVTCMTCFVLDFSLPGRWSTRRNLIVLAIPPLVAMPLAMFSDGRLMWRSIEGAPDGALVPHLTAVGGLVVTYGVGLGLLSAAVLLWLFARSPQHRWPAVLILCGLVAGRVLFLVEITQAPWPAGLDPLVLAYLAAWIPYAIALLGFHMLDPLPAARMAAMEQMQEGMVILDTHGRIANLNPAAARMLSTSAARVRGSTLQELWPAFSDLSHRVLGAGKPTATLGAQVKSAYAIEFSLETSADRRRLVLDCSMLEDFRGLFIGHLLMLRDVTEGRRAQEEAEKQQQALAVMRERERLARELHDSMAQVLAFVNLQGQAARRLLSRNEVAAANELVGRLVEAAREADTDIRESILGLRVALAGQGLRSALVTYLEQYQQRYGICAELRQPAGFDDGAFEPSVEVQLLRIIQEALTNARKHSRAQSVCVTFDADDGHARITVQDDGCGFDPAAEFDDPAGRVGLRVMQERAEEIGGALTIESAPGDGTRMILTAPLARRPGMLPGKEASSHASAVG